MPRRTTSHFAPGCCHSPVQRYGNTVCVSGATNFASLSPSVIQRAPTELKGTSCIRCTLQVSACGNKMEAGVAAASTASLGAVRAWHECVTSAMHAPDHSMRTNNKPIQTLVIPVPYQQHWKLAGLFETTQKAFSRSRVFRGGISLLIHTAILKPQR